MLMFNISFQNLHRIHSLTTSLTTILTTSLTASLTTYSLPITIVSVEVIFPFTVIAPIKGFVSLIG